MQIRNAVALQPEGSILQWLTRFVDLADCYIYFSFCPLCEKSNRRSNIDRIIGQIIITGTVLICRPPGECIPYAGRLLNLSV